MLASGSSELTDEGTGVVFIAAARAAFVHDDDDDDELVRACVSLLAAVALVASLALAGDSITSRAQKVAQSSCS